ncbi:MAG TPA: DinB family protein [Gemmatimonadaceae bacterium]|nr:DinB family protein [Gemmatimonadaceae bacterium]
MTVTTQEREGPAAQRLLHDDLLATYLTAPDRLREAVAGLADAELAATPPGGGRSLLQLVVHLADTELHALARIRRIIAEPGTRIEPYDSERWVQSLAPVTPVDAAIDLFAALRRAGAAVFRAATPEQRARTCFHPDRGNVSLDELLQLQALHAEQHIGQMREMRERLGAW